MISSEALVEKLAKTVDERGMLKIVRWATEGPVYLNSQNLVTTTTPLPEGMHGTVATGKSLVTMGTLGVDMINVQAGEAFPPHTHPGDHLLIIIAGHGTITYDGRIYPTFAGEMYMIAGAVPHAVGAITDHTILAVGAPHKAVSDPERMSFVPYLEVTAELGDMHCLICDKQVVYPATLHDIGCSHCPCPVCLPALEDTALGGHHAETTT